MVKFFRFIFPFIILSIFFIVVRHYYHNNSENFIFLKNINTEYILSLFVLGFFYLILETLILRVIVTFNNKNSSFFELFSVINVTYFCNSFIQFSGLGFRAFYLKKKLNIAYLDFLSISIFIILIELFIFSFLSFFILKFYEIYSQLNILNLYVEIFLIAIFSSILIFYLLRNYIFKILINIKISKNINFLKNINRFFKNIFIGNFEKIIPIIIVIFIFQFLTILTICSLSFNLYESNLINSFLFGVISAMSIDLSFIFSITPYSVGISEIFITYSTLNFNLNLANILSTANSFRFSLMVFYFIITPIYFITIIIKKK